MFQNSRANLTTLRKINKNRPLYFQQLYICNKKVDETRILYEFFLITNLIFVQFLNESIIGIKNIFNLKQNIQ